MAIKIALAGNPNCGKTTHVQRPDRARTSSSATGRALPWRRRKAASRAQKDVIIQDLPGIYSLSPVHAGGSRGPQLSGQRAARTRSSTSWTRPNMERNLYLTTQLAELGIPMVVALNMMDVVAQERRPHRRGASSARQLGCRSGRDFRAEGRRACMEAATAAVAAGAEKAASEPPAASLRRQRRARAAHSSIEEVVHHHERWRRTGRRALPLVRRQAL